MGLILAKQYIIEEEKEKVVEEFESSDVEIPRATPNSLNKNWIERLVNYYLTLLTNTSQQSNKSHREQ